MKCPCHSGQEYADCCKPYHESMQLPPTALQLMRSRYAAYALALADYLIDTTHPDNPRYEKDRKKWSESILQFSKATQFQNLEILEFQDGVEEAFVTFKAILEQAGSDATFTEKSRFLKVAGKWLYIDGTHTR